MSRQITIYWAAPCFTQAERFWNRCCAKYLEEEGYKVILPQDEANQFLGGGKNDFDGLAHHCEKQAIESNLMVAILDGPDSDSGMSMECGLRIGAGKKPTIGVRTDFRVAEDGQLNAMFRLLDEIIYFPAFDESYEKLCRLIDEAIKKRVPMMQVGPYKVEESPYEDREVEFYDPHPGVGGPVIPLPDSLKIVADKLNGERMLLSEAVSLIKKAIPQGVLRSNVEVNSDDCFIAVQLEYNVANHGWRLIRFK